MAEDLVDLQLLRVKRRRDEAPPALLIIQQAAGAGPAGTAADGGELQKRQRRETAESQALAGTGHAYGPGSQQQSPSRHGGLRSGVSARQLSQQLLHGLTLDPSSTAAPAQPGSRGMMVAPTAGGAAGADAAVASTAPAATTTTRRRYLRVQTLHKGALQGMAPEDVKQLVRSWRQAALTQQAAAAPQGQGGSSAVAEAALPQLHYRLVGCKRPLQQQQQQQGGHLQAHAASQALGIPAPQALVARSYSSSLSGSGSGNRAHLRHASGSPTSPAQASTGRASLGSRNSFGTGRAPAPTSSADPLGQLCRVIEVHAQSRVHRADMPEAQQGSPAAKRQRAAGLPAPQLLQPPAAEPPPPAAHLEELLRAHFLPMLDEYMGPVEAAAPAAPPSEPRSYKPPGRRRPVTGPAVTAAPVTSSNPAPQGLASAAGVTSPTAAGLTLPNAQWQPRQQQQQQGQVQGQRIEAGHQEAGEGEAEEEEDMVFDVYVPVEDEGGDAALGCAEGDLAHVPVIEVPDPDDELWWGLLEGPGQAGGWAGEGVHSDSEDSNAESFYANSYPEDEEEDEDETEDEFGSYERRGSTTNRSRSMRAWDEEEFDVNDYDSDKDEEVGSLDAVAASRRAAQAFLRAALERRGAQQASSGGKGAAGRTATARLRQIM